MPPPLPSLPPLVDEADYERALADIAAFMADHPASGTPEDARFDALVDQVVAYEEVHWPMGDDPP
jgi:antitoxin component HigA of HigAB toxin-antitoxin module